MDEFGDLTGIKISKLQDISAFEIPQRAMAEALSKSPEFDFFHVDTNMIPSLASAGLLEPLDEYMKSAGFSINAVGDFGKFLTYKGKTYGITTDGNVHVQFIRSDLWNDPDERKAFADKHGRELTWPDTWEEDLEIMKFFHRPDKDLYGTASLRDRGSSTAWWYMYLYSAGGFPFTTWIQISITRLVNMHSNLSRSETGFPPGSCRLGHASDDPSDRQWPSVLLSVLGWYYRARGKSQEIQNYWQMGLWSGSGFEEEWQTN